MPLFWKNCIFGWFLGFFSKLVSSIELILSPFSQCLSRACFDRSATTLIFDPIMGIFKISKVRYEGQIWKQCKWHSILLERYLRLKSQYPGSVVPLAMFDPIMGIFKFSNHFPLMKIFLRFLGHFYT